MIDCTRLIVAINLEETLFSLFTLKPKSANLSDTAMTSAGLLRPLRPTLPEMERGCWSGGMFWIAGWESYQVLIFWRGDFSDRDHL